MFYNIFLIYFIIIFINIRRTNSSLLSRFRNPNEYVPPDSSKYFFPEDLDDNMYAELLEEVPELAGKLRYHQYDDVEEDENTMLPFIKKEINGSFELIPNDEEFDTEKDEYQEEYPGQLEYITVTEGQKKNSSTRRLPFLTRWPLNSSYEWARRQNMTPERFIFDIYQTDLYKSLYKKVARCYWCGMNQTGLPTNSLCHDAFESPDWRARTLARYFRTVCRRAWFHHRRIRPFKTDYGTRYYTDHGLVRERFGGFSGGCFKRFLDVGNMYTQRGCRRWWPQYATRPNFVTHRFTRLEALIRKDTDYCIVSPHASLTPFSRSISLYVRYHVCVCTGRYCNKTIKLQCSLTLLTLILLILNLTCF